jgi:hypothetical protein
MLIDLFTTSARIMRCLCSIHIFKEVQPDRFANNGVSAALVNNEPLRAYIVMLYVFASPEIDNVLI